MGRERPCLPPFETAKGAAPTGKYEEDVHRDLTAVLAQAAGFDEKTAQAIGNADQGVDDSSTTGPISGGEDARKNYHFTSVGRRNEMWSTFQDSKSTDDLGAFLHAEQDSYSHAGFTAEKGHWSKRPDKTYNDPAMADTMANDTYNKLVAAAGRLGIDPKTRVAWAKIDKLVSAFDRATTRKEKDKILKEIKDTVTRSHLEGEPKKAKQEARQ